MLRDKNLPTHLHTLFMKLLFLRSKLLQLALVKLFLRLEFGLLSFKSRVLFL